MLGPVPGLGRRIYKSQLMENLNYVTDSPLTPTPTFFWWYNSLQQSKQVLRVQLELGEF